ncbi:hypothetical protein C8J56DRAFT_786259 [Mycena floridula]|nr:hypothetical protein C8J56DRAFT_786259 [Mycena floridula]
MVDLSRRVGSATRIIFELFADGFACWWMDLFIALSELSTPVYLSPLHELSDNIIDDLSKQVYKSAMISLQNDIDNSPRLYLLHGREEPLADEDSRDSRYNTLALRHYLLLVTIQSHRHAITHLLVDGHPLASETMRYSRTRISPEARLCHFCHSNQETPEHVLLGCIENLEMIELRSQFLDDINKCISLGSLLEMNDLTSILKALIFNRETISCVAKFVHEVFCIIRSVALPNGV